MVTFADTMRQLLHIKHNKWVPKYRISTGFVAVFHREKTSGLPETLDQRCSWSRVMLRDVSEAKARATTCGSPVFADETALFASTVSCHTPGLHSQELHTLRTDAVIRGQQKKGAYR